MCKQGSTQGAGGRELLAALERTAFSVWPSSGLRSGGRPRPSRPEVSSGGGGPEGKGKGSSKEPLRTKGGARNCKVTKPYGSGSKTSGNGIGLL